MSDDFKHMNEVIDKLKFVKLSDELIDDLANFDCLNPDEEFEGFKSKQRKKFRKYSEEINNFIKEEALEEQNQALNTTHLLYYYNRMIGFISLCSDSLRLELEERKEYEIPYANIPSLKIARLAIDKDYQNKGLGKLFINYVVNLILQIRESVGIKFITVDCYKHRLSYYEGIGFIINKSQRENREPDSPLSLRLHIDKYLENLNI